jgi:hypothetical protein
MIYRSIMMVILMLSITWLTDPKLFAGVTPSGNKLFYGKNSPQKVDENGFITLEVQFDVIPAAKWIPAFLKYEVWEYNKNGGYLTRQFFSDNQNHSQPRWYFPQNQFTSKMKVINPRCDFSYIGPPPYLPHELAMEPDSEFVNID